MHKIGVLFSSSGLGNISFQKKEEERKKKKRRRKNVRGKKGIQNFQIIKKKSLDKISLPFAIYVGSIRALKSTPLQNPGGVP